MSYRIRHYWRTLWIALCGDAGFVYVRSSYLKDVESRLSTFEAEKKKQHENRSRAQLNRKAKPKETQ